MFNWTTVASTNVKVDAHDFQKKTKYKVKFDKGARGLLSSNHIALESNPHPSVLNVGSRVVGMLGAVSLLCIYLELERISLDQNI